MDIAGAEHRAVRVGISYGSFAYELNDTSGSGSGGWFRFGALYGTYLVSLLNARFIATALAGVFAFCKRPHRNPHAF